MERAACLRVLLIIAAPACASRASPPAPPAIGPSPGAVGSACAPGTDYAVMSASTPPAWLPDEETQGACDMDRDGRLLEDEFSSVTVEVGHTADGPFTLTHMGPHGSGRYWQVGVSFAAPPRVRGFCFLTSTVGWRHVGGNPGLAARLSRLVRWIQDVDGDGGDELVVPSSFPVSGRADQGDDAITVSVYDRSDGGFVVDENSTRMLRARIADAYAAAARSPRIGRDDRDHYRGAEQGLRQEACDSDAAESRGSR